MNARGKQLTRYENLKAYIESDAKITNAHKLLANIDNKWADMFFMGGDFSAFDKRGFVFLHYANVFFKLLNSEVKSVAIKAEIKTMIDTANRATNDFYQPLQNLWHIMLLDRLVDLYRLHSEAFESSGFFKI